MQPENPQQPPFPEGAKRPQSSPDPQQSQQAPPPPPPGGPWDPRADRWAARAQRREDRWHRRQERWGRNPGGGLFIGLFVTLMGVAFLLRNLNIIYFDNIGRFWPVLLIALGISKLTSSQRSVSWTGVAFAGFGTLLLLNNFNLIPFNPWRSFWPLWMIGVGVWMLLRHLDGGGPRNGPPGAGWGGGAGGSGPMGPGGTGPTGPGTPGSPNTARFSSEPYNPNSWSGAGESGTKTIYEEVVFSGAQRKITCQEFEGGKISALFGGVQVDLREANTKLDTMKLHCDAIFGGIDVWIPQTWQLDMRGTGVFGAFHNQTFTKTMPNGHLGSPRLILTGGAVFGGVTIKN
ncbi:MAG: DUF5668 domain-containing protein [Acidobacteriota bacterium]